jgi:hypothetical protein
VRRSVISLVLCAVALTACGSATPGTTSGTNSGTTSGGAPSAAGPGQTPPATEPPTSAKPGKPVVTTDGKKVHVEGVGVGNSDKFDLTGNYLMTITACKATGVTPFIVLRSATTNLAPTYVDAETHLKNLSGKYDVEISPAQSCAWAVDFAPE